MIDLLLLRCGEKLGVKGLLQLQNDILAEHRLVPDQLLIFRELYDVGVRNNPFLHLEDFVNEPGIGVWHF